MKYAVIYTSPNKRTRRTRTSSLKRAKMREKFYKEHGFETRILTNEELNLKAVSKSDKKRVGRMSNISNHWKFIPDKSDTVHCNKNGEFVPMNKALL